MRNVFAETVFQMAALDQRIVLLSGDIGNRLFDPFKASFPKRFYNCGIAEANMTGVAAGLASCGLRPITYTITPFNTTRCLEQIRVDVAYHNLPVIIVGTGSGLSYGSLGCTHHSLEDISFLRSLPNMTVLCPGDSLEMKGLLFEAVKKSSPVYLRIGKKGDPVCYESQPKVVIGKGHVVQEGKEAVIFTTGNTLSLAMKVGKELMTGVISMHTVKPLDEELLLRLSKKFSFFVSIEEHSLIGGLGSALAEWMVDNRVKIPLIRFGTGDRFYHKFGSQEYLRNSFGLNMENICGVIKKELNACELKRPF